eukprot:scaffold5748_cov124-Isochrysis_galbana.AAC.1
MGCGSSTEAAAPAPAETARRVPDAKPPTPQPQSNSNSQRTNASSAVVSEAQPSLPPSLTPSPRSPRSLRTVTGPFIAYVVSDFAAVTSNELSVNRGDFVTVEPVEGLPEGWCMASIAEPGKQKRAGLVPWQYLVSSAHAEEAAVNPRGREPERVMLEFKISRGKTGALGLDLDEENQVRRIAEGSSAKGQLEVGDLVLAVDGKSLEGDLSILDVLDASLSVYTFSVLRRELNGIDKDAYSAGIMDTVRLQAQSDSKSSTKYYSAPGRDPGQGGKGSAASVEEEESSSARDSERSNTVDGGLPANFFSPAQQVQQGARMTRLERVVKVRRTGARLGIDINERNVIVKLIPGSHALTDGNLREGDVVIAVDGEQLEGRWLAQVIRPGADTYLFTVVSEDWKIGTLQEQQGTGPNQLPDTAALRDIYSLKSWSLTDVAAAISSGDGSKAAATGGAAAVRAPSALREVPEETSASFASPAARVGSRTSSPPGTSYRMAPCLPNNMSTMRIEDMLRGAMEAAAENPQHARQFEEVLSRYKQHPGILRREEEARARDRARRETFKPAYWAQRRRIPERVHLRMNSIDELVDAGCAWDLAEEIMRFPILKFLRATHEAMEALPIFETVCRRAR